MAAWLPPLKWRVQEQAYLVASVTGQSPAMVQHYTKKVRQRLRAVQAQQMRSEEVEDLEAEKILAAYPEDRIRDRRTTLRLISGAMKAGVEPDDLKLAVTAYAKESEGYP